MPCHATGDDQVTGLVGFDQRGVQADDSVQVVVHGHSPVWCAGLAIGPEPALSPARRQGDRAAIEPPPMGDPMTLWRDEWTGSVR